MLSGVVGTSSRICPTRLPGPAIFRRECVDLHCLPETFARGRTLEIVRLMCIVFRFGLAFQKYLPVSGPHNQS